MLLPFVLLDLRFTALDTLILPARNKGNVLRGALGTVLRRQVCDSACPGPRQCTLRATCPYARVFEPAAPDKAPALSNYEAIPRPFVIRPPLDGRTCYEPGETLRFGMVLIAGAMEFMPHLVMAFAQVADDGLGSRRARCRLDVVEQIAAGDSFDRLTRGASALLVRFLTPTHLVAGGEAVTEPRFHHLVARLRDRTNALATFYGAGPLNADFKGLGERARAVRSERCDVVWERRERRSSRTGQRHAIGGFMGECIFSAETPQQLAEFLPLIEIGQYVHVGKHAAWGNGWYRVGAGEPESPARGG